MEPKKRKIVMVANHIHMHEEDTQDVVFWLSQSASERLKAVKSLRENYFTWLNGSFPEKITKVVARRKL